MLPPAVDRFSCDKRINALSNPRKEDVSFVWEGQSGWIAPSSRGELIGHRVTSLCCYALGTNSVLYARTETKRETQASEKKSERTGHSCNEKQVFKNKAERALVRLHQ